MTYREYFKENCPLYTHGSSKRKIRHDFFKSIDSELQAYLLGFIFSDGSINDKRATLTININPLDKEIFKLFKVISPDAYVLNCKGYESKATIDGRTIKNNGSIRLAIASSILINDLHKLGVVLNKTYENLSIPNIPDKLIRHFIRGYFDGDGCVTWSVRKPNPANREINYRVCGHFEICGKTDNIFKEMQEFLTKNDIKANINYIKRNDMYRLIGSSKESIKKFYNLLYDDSHFYLKRKFEKYNYYVNTEVSQIIIDHRNALEVNVNESNNPPKSAEHLNSSKKDENVR